ncbi:WYL domain-containing protein [Paratractidigestivibacter sp.]|uniref:helix-turn-helix transcriptional regulator n=1 Tax=Paratractidigestivibacter sp. TaxID=2847316 RepID=UPI002AC9B62D|nr:WYL domain-containing protein [Paratractidigestivibacter sp.]
MSSTEIDFNADERRGKRVATLGVFFANAGGPVSTSMVDERFYADLGDENRRKTFKRDRDLLAEAGIVIREAGTQPVSGGGSEKLWEADAEASFASETELEPLEAIGLDIACQPLLEDPGFVFSRALRRALAKIDRTFGDPDQAVAANTPQVDAVTEVISDCIESGVAAHISYRDANGAQSERLFAPLGTFSLRGRGYAVGDMVEEGGARRTLRLDRILGAERTATRYDAPVGFDINEYRRLPFQIGEARFDAVFEVPTEREADLRRAAIGKGKFAQLDGRLTWRVDGVDEKAAAAWAVAQGIRPLSPQAVVDAWKRCLEGVLARG